MVSFARRGEGDHRDVAAPLQRGASAFESRLSDAERVRGSTQKRSVPSGNGPGRCGFAPRPVAQPAPRGAHAASNGSRLKLTVVRRIRAGHDRLLGATDDGPDQARMSSYEKAKA